MQEGIIKRWSGTWGFIRPLRGRGPEPFVHIGDITPDNCAPREGDRVKYEVRDTDRGPRAYNVELQVDYNQAA